MADLLSETLLTFAQAARRYPANRGEGTASPETVWRWCMVGKKSPDGTMVKLEAIKIAGWCTSVEALNRFFRALTPAGQAAAGAKPIGAKRRTPRQRRRWIDRKKAELGAA